MDYALPTPFDQRAAEPSETPDAWPAANDPEAFNALVLQHQARLYATAYYLLGEREAAADALQEALLAAYRHLPRARPQSLKAWLARIVTRKCFDQLRALKRRQALALEALPEDSPLLASRAEGPEARVQRRELAQALEASLARLTVTDRQLVILRDVLDLSYGDMAAAADCPLGTVKSRLSRARAKLRADLAGRVP